MLGEDPRDAHRSYNGGFPRNLASYIQTQLPFINKHFTVSCVIMWITD